MAQGSQHLGTTADERPSAPLDPPTLAQSMPLWTSLGEPLLKLLVSHGLIEHTDEPSTVFNDLSMEGISEFITLSADDESRLALLGCKSDDQLAMPPPPPHRGVKRTAVLNFPSARPGCVDGGSHLWQRCTICHGLVGGTDGSAICAIPGCGIMRPTKGRFCDCLEIEAHPAATPDNTLLSASTHTGSAELVATKQSACILYVGHSLKRQVMCTVLLRLRSTADDGERYWCTPGGYLLMNENPARGALREMCEELLSLPAPVAAQRADEMLAHSTGHLTGPYGRTHRHHAFMLQGLLGRVDNLVSNFEPNDEVDRARLVPVSAIDGSATIIKLDGETLLLRDKIGHMRARAAKALRAPHVSPPAEMPLTAVHFSEGGLTVIDDDELPSHFYDEAAAQQDSQQEQRDYDLAKSLQDLPPDSGESMAAQQAQDGPQHTRTLLHREEHGLSHFMERHMEDLDHDIDHALALSLDDAVRRQADMALQDQLQLDEAIAQSLMQDEEPQAGIDASDTDSDCDLPPLVSILSDCSDNGDEDCDPTDLDCPDRLPGIEAEHNQEGVCNGDSAESADAALKGPDELELLRRLDAVRSSSTGSLRDGAANGLRDEELERAITENNAELAASAEEAEQEALEERHAAANSANKARPQADVWRPSATSMDNRARSHQKTIATSATASTPPLRYSDAPSLARSAGHDLTADAAGSPGGTAPWELLPPPPEPSHPSRTIGAIDTKSDVTLFPREYRLPLPEGFKMPPITHYAFYEHGGHIRNSWRRRGYTSASVADRPTLTPPLENSYHFIGQVYDFVQIIAAHGLLIYAQTSHVECGPSAWASWKVWPEKIKDGRMLQAAEELLWITCIGARSFSEHPHTAHEHLIGPPTQVANANQHGGYDKTWCIWSRHAGVLEPTNIVPPQARASILSSVTGDRDQRMLQRSATEEEMANAITASIDRFHALDDEPRRADQPCAAYGTWRRALHHNFGILAASYAPTIDAAHFASSTRTAPLALLVPIAQSEDGSRVMVPLRTHLIFGIELVTTSSYKSQAEQASTFLNVGIDTHHMHGLRNQQGDIVVAVPWDITPVKYMATPSELQSAASTNAPAVWVSPHALAGSLAFEPVMFAVQRLVAMGGPVTHDELNVGVWDRAKPVVLRQRARRYGSLPASPAAELQWRDFLRVEQQRVEHMQRDLIDADKGTGYTAGIVADVRTANDYAAELPVPPQGLPTFDDASLLLVKAPERPLPLHTDWLHRLPPQRVPPGFVSIAYTDALRLWARRMIADNKNASMRYDAYCLLHGHAPDHLRRPNPLVLGRGAGKLIPFNDGVGHFNIFDILLERGEDGLFYPLDFEKPERRVWLFDVIQRYIGATTNQEIMSFFYHGVRWKIRAPQQIRLLSNLRRMDTRIAKVNTKLRELTSKGYISAHPICKVSDGITASGPNPFLFLFEWDCPLGGTDKPGRPDVARVVGDMSAPRNVRERNRPDGEPDGPPVISFNDLSGPKGGVPPDYEGYAPFPHPEVKPRPKHKYTATAYLMYYAHLNGSFCVTFTDDQVDCFFQYFVAHQELHLCRWNTVGVIDDTSDVWYVAYKVYTMNQGGRNSSKIACDGNEEWLDAWRRQMDIFVTDWLPRQTPALQSAHETRSKELGFYQARPFWAALYTDNFDFTFCASDLAAHGAFIWRKMNSEAHIRMQQHVTYGTCSDWIGARFLVTGGFGCITPSKRQRAISNIERSLAGQLTRELFEKNNSFLVHVADICDWPVDALQGIYGPLKKPGFDDDKAIMTPLASNRLTSALQLLRARPLASFWSGVTDAYSDWEGTGHSRKRIRVHAFDTCTDPVPTPGNPNPKPHVAGMVDGLWWRFELQGEWLDRHITLTEAIGPAIGALVTVPLFPEDINVLASDATAAAAAGIDRAHAVRLQTLRRTLKEEPLFHEHVESMWHTHWKGWGNGIVDCLSRDDLAMAHRIAHAFGIKLVELDISHNVAVNRFLHRLCIRSRPAAADAFQIQIKGFDGHTMLLDVSPSTTVASLTELYLVEIGAEAADGRISYRGKELDLANTMLELGIAKDDVLHAVLRGRAGMRDVSDPPSPLLTAARETPSSLDAAAPSSPPPTVSHNTPGPASPHHTPVAGFGCLRSVPPSPPTADPMPQASRHATRCTHGELADVPDTHIVAASREGSPQPLTAAAARSAAARNTADALANDSSEYALCRDNPQMLHSLIMQIAEAKVLGVPKGTSAADAWGFKWAVAFGTDTNTRWMTPRIGSPDINQLTERWRTAVCLFWIAQHMSPSARRQRAGFKEAKPTSPLLAVYGWRRVLRGCDRYLSDMTQVLAVLKGLCALAKRTYGPEAFAIHQAKILSSHMLLAIAAALQGSDMRHWAVALIDAWQAMHPFLIATGTRKEEITASHPGDDNLRRMHFVWISADGDELAMTADIIRSRCNGDLLRGQPAPSKCDRLGITWSKQKQFFRYDDSDPLNFPVAWQHWELMHPCPISERAQWPAFSPSGNHQPFSPQQAASTHQELVVRAVGAEAAADVTIHSYRGTLVSAMYVARAQGHTQFAEGVMQAHVRHKTLDAMYGYGKLLPTDYADNVAIITRVDPALARRDKLPEHEPTAMIASVEAIIDELGGDSAHQANQTPPATRSTKAPSADTLTRAHAPETIMVVGCERPVAVHHPDPWEIVGSKVDLPNELWGEGEGLTACRIAHFIHKHKYPSGGSHLSYAVAIDQYDGLYAVRADTVARHVPPPLRAQLKKKPMTKRK